MGGFNLIIFTSVIASRCLPSWRKELSAHVYARYDSLGPKSHKFSWSLLARHLYARQLACEPQTGSAACLSVAVTNGTKERPVLSIEGLHPEKCRLLLLLLLLCLYARKNNSKNSWQLKQGSIWKHETKSMTCLCKQAARETISLI